MNPKSMSDSLKIQLSQLNFAVGDLNKNCEKILENYQKAKAENVDLIVFSELSICGYPPEDLLLRKYFLDEIYEKIEEIKLATKGSKTAILLGTPYFYNKDLQNCAIVIENGEIICVASKNCLPNYGVFDENRYFKAAPTLTNFSFRGFRLVILICEDIWRQRNSFLLGDKEFDAIISINASPFSYDKKERRIDVTRKFIKDLKKPVFYVNQVGGQDSLVFDGGSFVMDENGEVALQAKEFEEDTLTAVIPDLIGDPEKSKKELDPRFREDDKEGRIYNALILGLRDYIHKNNFQKVVIGMSGGIDSALVACIAIDALGSENVKLVALPSKYNSKTSMDDALKASENLGIKLDVVEIENAVESINQALLEQFQNTKKDLTEENIQSRTRGNILMAISNKFGNLLLSTGNKSELATGYATLYGDMCGAFNPLKDVYKTEVFEIAKWRNKNIPQISVYKKTDLIPQNIITKEPTAELRENQKDSDSLPPYEILDKILFGLIEEQKSTEEIIKSGFDEEIVRKVSKLFLTSEYKRRQSVIGPRVSEMSFDKDRRYPITNKFNY